MRYRLRRPNLFTQNESTIKLMVSGTLILLIPFAIVDK